MKIGKKLINLEVNEKICGEETEARINLMDLPPEMLSRVANFLSRKQLIRFGLVNKKCQQSYLHTLNRRFTKSVDLRKLFYLNEKKMWKKVKHLNYRRVNLHHCYNLRSGFITELVSKDSLRAVDLICCKCTSKVVAAVTQLHLTSFSISLSNKWKTFFVSNEHNSVPFLNRLKKLEFFHWNESRMLMSHAARYVLPHCHQLHSLKLFTMPVYVYYRYEDEAAFQLPKLTSTPVPQLESLILDFHNLEDMFHRINAFLDLILYKKKIPLTNVYLGKQTLKVFSSGNLCRENLTFENAETFCFSRPNYLLPRSFRKLENVECKIEMFAPVLKSKKYNKIVMENMILGDLSKLPKVFLNSGNTSIQEINLNGSEMEKGLSNFLTGISNFNSGITFLDISVARWPPTTENNELANLSLINSLAKLTNLRTLYMIPSMLRHTECDKDALKLTFFEVTNKCTFLRDLRIVDKNNTELISREVLALIKHFKSLKKLHLVNFSIAGDKAVLTEIVESCTKLKYLRISNVLTETRLEEMLVHAKSFKHLRIEQQNLKLTKTLVDNLSECTQLEKLCISRIDREEDVDIIRYLGESLKKLNKLQIFSSNQLRFFENQFKSAINEIKEKRPWCFFNDGEQSLPLAHHEFLRAR